MTEPVYGDGGWIYDVAAGNVSGVNLWNKFGYNTDIDIGTEVIASFGGTYNPLLAASTVSFVSDSAEDASGGTGAGILIVFGVDENWNEITEVLPITGLTPAVTTNSWFGIDRVSVYLCGTSLSNVGTITGTATSDASFQAQLPAGEGTTQQCIFTTPAGRSACLTSLLANILKTAGGTNPVCTITGYVYSHVSQAKYETFRYLMDTTQENHIEILQQVPFVVGEKSQMWFDCTTDKDNTSVSLRFSFIEV